MSRNKVGRSSEILYDKELVDTKDSGYLAFATAAVSNKGSFVAPGPCRIAEIHVRTLASTTASTALINIGKNGTADNILANHSQENVAAGAAKVAISSLATGADLLAEGDAVSFQTEAATAVGAVAITLVLVPADQTDV